MRKMYGAIKFPAEIHFERLEFVWSSVERLSKAKVSENVVNWNTWNWLRIKVVVSFILLNIELSGIVEFNWFWSGAVFHCSSMSIIIILFFYSHFLKVFQLPRWMVKTKDSQIEIWMCENFRVSYKREELQSEMVQHSIRIILKKFSISTKNYTFRWLTQSTPRNLRCVVINNDRCHEEFMTERSRFTIPKHQTPIIPSQENSVR